MRRNDIIDQIMIDSDLVIILDYSYAEVNEIDTDMILRNFVDQIITKMEPIIQDQDKIDKIKTHLGLAKHSSC